MWCTGQRGCQGCLPHEDDEHEVYCSDGDLATKTDAANVFLNNEEMAWFYDSFLTRGKAPEMVGKCLFEVL